MNSTQKTSGLPSLLLNRWIWLGAAALALLAWFVLPAFFQPAAQATAFHEVKRGDFLVTIVEGGTLEAVNEVIIRNEVEGNSRVIYIVPEGTYVKKGDLLVQLDTAEAVLQVNQQEIAFEKAKAALIQAQTDLEIQKSTLDSAIDTARLKYVFAEIDLDKFKKGQMLQELRNAEIEITTANSDLLLAQDTLEWSEKLYTQGFETKNAVDQARNQVLDLKLKMEKAQTNLWVITNFDHPKNLKKFESDMAEARKEWDRAVAQSKGKMAQLSADLITQSNSLMLTEAKLNNDRTQLEKSKIYAPQEGLVVYAMNRSRYSSESLIEEGAMVRNRQELVKLPDTSQMKVSINVHESHVNKVRPGQAAFITLDNLPDLRFRAEVTKVAVLPDTRSQFGNPNLKIYKTEILVKDPLPDVKPGVSARAEIVITNIPGALTIPIQAVTSLKGTPVAYVKRGASTEPVPVEVGLFNTKFIEIKSGLKEREFVLLSPPFDAQEKDLGGAVIGQDEDIPEADLKANPNPVRPNGVDGPSDPARGPGGFESSQGPGGGPRTGRGEGGERGERSGRSGFNREEMMKRFDTNGDGTLDDAERAAMREQFGGGGRTRGPGGGGESGGGTGGEGGFGGRSRGGEGGFPGPRPNPPEGSE